MESYDIIRIQVFAPSEYVNDNHKEMELSDELVDIEDALKEWLRNRSRGTKLVFKVLEDFDEE
jgi:hypothetical protein